MYDKFFQRLQHLKILGILSHHIQCMCMHIRSVSHIYEPIKSFWSYVLKMGIFMILLFLRCLLYLDYGKIVFSLLGYTKYSGMTVKSFESNMDLSILSSYVEPNWYD